jgi:hypothetical protein
MLSFIEERSSVPSSSSIWVRRHYLSFEFVHQGPITQKVENDTTPTNNIAGIISYWMSEPPDQRPFRKQQWNCAEARSWSIKQRTTCNIASTTTLVRKQEHDLRTWRASQTVSNPWQSLKFSYNNAQRSVMELNTEYRVLTSQSFEQQSLSLSQSKSYPLHALTDIDAVKAAIMRRKEKRIVCGGWCRISWWDNSGFNVGKHVANKWLLWSDLDCSAGRFGRVSSR